MELRLVAARPAEVADEALRKRERAAWDALVAHQHGRLYNLLVRLTGDRELAADLTQETFLAAYRSAHTYAGRSGPEAWLCGVALNCYRNHRRRHGGRGLPDEIGDGLPDPAPTPEQLAQLREQADLLREAVGRLPEAYERVVALYYFAGLTSAQIAEEEGVADGTVRWRLHQAVRKLWFMLQPHTGKEEPA